MADWYLIVGLGNPGKEYEDTRHNVGFRVMEELARRYGMAFGKTERKAQVASGTIKDKRVILAKPQTFMNLSGESVGAVATFFKFAPSEILVAHDEMAFEPGVLRLKRDGGHNGHNGLRDIIASLGNDAGFARLRIGVGHPGHKDRVSGYLTGAKMRGEDRALVRDALMLSDELLGLMCAGEFAKAMNVLHTAGNGDD